jgi:hypothetical protein
MYFNLPKWVAMEPGVIVLTHLKMYTGKCIVEKQMTDVFPRAWERPATGPGSLALLPAAEEGAANVKI